MKQKKVLDIFRGEQKELMTDLTVAGAGARVFEDDKNCEKITDLLSECDKLDEEIKLQEFHLEEIEGQMNLNKKKVNRCLKEINVCHWQMYNLNLILAY